MHFTCPHCDAQYLIKQEWLGLQVRCPGCQEVVQLPQKMSRVPALPTERDFTISNDDSFAFLPEEETPAQQQSSLPKPSAVPGSAPKLPPAIPQKSLGQKLMLPLVLGGVALVVAVGVALIFWGGKENDSSHIAVDQAIKPMATQNVTLSMPPETGLKSESAPQSDFRSTPGTPVDARTATLNYWNALLALPEPNIPQEPSDPSQVPGYMQTLAREMGVIETRVQAIPSQGVDPSLLAATQRMLNVLQGFRFYLNDLSRYTPQDYAVNQTQIMLRVGQFLTDLGTVAMDMDTVRLQINQQYGLYLAPLN